eukprot:s2025_g7.t1
MLSVAGCAWPCVPVFGGPLPAASWAQQAGSRRHLRRLRPKASILAATALTAGASASSPRRNARAGAHGSARSSAVAMGGIFGQASVPDYFAGKVVWITGASGGFGEALAKRLAQDAKLKGLILSARRQDALERVRESCLKLASGELKVQVLPLDLAEIATLPEAAATAKSFFGEVGILINNGGIGFRGLGEETEIEIDQMVMNVDYFSGVVLTKSLLPDWLRRGEGHVVQVSSVQGFFGLPGRTAYAAAKHAAVGFYDSLRAEVADRGVSVTTICPGYIATGHSENAAKGEGVKYPEGHTSKGVLPEVLAPEVLKGIAQKRPEMVPAALDARAARLLRTCCPHLLFCIMRRRAQKEARLRAAHQLTDKKSE